MNQVAESIQNNQKMALANTTFTSLIKKQLSASEITLQSPLKFSLNSFVSPNDFEDEDFLDCTVYRNVAKELSERLFEEKVVQLAVLEQSIKPVTNEVKVQCFDAQGEFDQAVCCLRLNNLGPTRFLAQTSFYQENKLVAKVAHNGNLA